MVLRGGSVLTGDPGRARTSAVALRGGRVVALGDEALRLDADVATDLGGATLLPGFRDGHIHPLWGGTEQLDAPVVEATDLDDLLERVRRHAEANPDAEWVVGHGYPCELLPGAMGTAVALDAAVADRPAALWASDHHTMWVNSRALEAAGIDATTPEPPRGEIVRDAEGNPTGMLLEAAMDLVTPLIPERDVQDKATGLRLALAQMRAHGIVWAQEAALAPADVDVYLALAAAGELTCGIDIALRSDPARWREQRAEFSAARARVRAAGGSPSPGAVTCRTVKVFVDGVIESGTGALLEPYLDAPHSCGIGNWEPDELVEAACAFDADGFQLHLHAIGDAAIRQALDAVEAVHDRNGGGPVGDTGPRRPVIAHTQLVDPLDLPRFAALGVIANFEPLWAQRSPVMTELTEPRLGPERSARQYPVASLLRSGAVVSFGSDWPVSSMDPLEGIATAVTRQTPQGQPPGGWTPHERLELDEAIAAYTRGVAVQANLPEAGRVAVGAPADLCLLDGEIHDLAPAKLPALDVRATWVAGQEVHRR